MSDDDIPEIPATGEKWIDTQIRAVLDATATEQRNAATFSDALLTHDSTLVALQAKIYGVR